MKDYFKKVAPVVFGSLLALILGASFVSAQTSVGLQIKPAVVDGTINPGETREYILTVTNISQAAETLYMSAQDIESVDDAGGPIFAKPGGSATGFELSSWITLPQAPFTLDPGTSKSISFSVRVPTNASPGSHFASVFFSDKPIAPQLSGSAVGFTVGSIVSLKIAGAIKEDAQLREFSTGKLVYATADVDFRVKVQNSGNVLVQPGGFIEITDMFGKKVGNVTVNDQLASTFPNANRVYPAEWKSDSFSFGRYQAVATLVYGDEARRTIYSTTSFWVLPLVPIAIVLGVLLTVVLLAYWLMHSYIQRKLRQMGVDNTSISTGYSKKYRQSSSRLMVVTMAVILLCIVFLVILFLMFA